jgi:hypothetical protein
VIRVPQDDLAQKPSRQRVRKPLILRLGISLV